ncbi:MAG TPA: NHL repeat-containing protein, partial [Candidatus Nitrosotenuis sp.]|nr:NHL repeat-containing protein [Candidatus Nitrosotenuis sp.]
MNGGILATESGFLLGLHLLVGSVLWADGSGAIRRVFEFPGGRTSLSGVGGLARDARGRVYAADTQGQRLLVFSPEGRPLGEVGGDRTPYERAGLNCIDLPGVLEDPNDVAVDQEGCVYVACGEQFMKNGVQKFSAAGEHLASFPSMGDPEGVFGGPRGLALHPDGTLWVCDTLRHGLQVFDRQGGFVGFLGHPHSDPLTAPLGVAFLPGGEVLVAEGGKSRRLVVLTARGALLRQFAPRTSPDAVPTQVSVWDEAVYVLERYTTGSGVRVLRYDLDGQLRAVPIADELDLARKVLAYLERSHPTTSAIQLRMANLYHYL